MRIGREGEGEGFTLARRVLPQPGGPANNIPGGCFKPNLVN